jgi:hypothetical protein
VILDQPVEHVGLLAVVEVLGDGHAQGVLPQQGRRLAHDDEPVAVLVGQGLEEHAIDHAEDGGVGADAEGQREHGQGGVAGVLQQRPARRSGHPARARPPS